MKFRSKHYVVDVEQYNRDDGSSIFQVQYENGRFVYYTKELFESIFEPDVQGILVHEVDNG